MTLAAGGKVDNADFGGLPGAWTAYTPTFTNVTGGAGTFATMQIGKTLFVRGRFTAGTATAAGTCAFSLPAGVTWLGTAESVVGINQTGAWTAVPALVRGTAGVEFVKVSGANFAIADPLTGYTFTAVLEVA